MIPRFSNILVPVDFAKKNWSALDVAFEMAVSNESSVTLLHVIETVEGDSPDDDPEIVDFYRRLEDRATRELESMGQRFIEAGINVHERIRYGKRPIEIVKFSNEHESDLILMSSHPIDETQPVANLATVSYQVSVVCSCPILLVK